MTDLIRPFDGTSDVGEWLSKVGLVADLRNIEDLAQVLPLFLEGPAYAVYCELSKDKKKDINAIKAELKEVIIMNAYLAYELFIQRVWRDEPVDVYLMDLRRLARLADVTSDKLLKKAFVYKLCTYSVSVHQLYS